MILFADPRFLFEGHLTVGQEPPPPAWLVADNLARELSILTESSGGQDGNTNRMESRAEDVTPAIMNFLESISGNRDLETALEESLQVSINTDHFMRIHFFGICSLMVTLQFIAV
jgi:E3 ubiquitin-protein ligase AIP2